MQIHKSFNSHTNKIQNGKQFNIECNWKWNISVSRLRRRRGTIVTEGVFCYWRGCANHSGHFGDFRKLIGIIHTLYKEGNEKCVQSSISHPCMLRFTILIRINPWKLSEVGCFRHGYPHPYYLVSSSVVPFHTIYLYSFHFHDSRDRLGKVNFNHFINFCNAKKLSVSCVIG